MSEKTFKIDINAPFGGFAPAYWENTYPSYGNSNQAGKMQEVDILNPVWITQGPGLSTLTNGTQAGNVSTLIKNIYDTPSASGVAWAIGGNTLYKLSATAVSNAYTINKAVVTGEDGESCVELNGYVYYFYNHSGSAGDMGRFTISGSSNDEDYGSTTPTGAATLQNAPHPSVIGNDGIIYFGNGAYVGYYDPVDDVISVDELDFPPGSQVVDLAYHNDRLYVAVNYPNLTGTNNNWGVIYVWQGPGIASWDAFPNPRIQGKIGAIYSKDGNLFVWYQDFSISGLKLGYLNGNKIEEISNFDGTLPNFGQRIEYKNCLAWVSGGKVYIFGSIAKDLPVGMSQYADGGYATVGALGVPFGTPLLASTDGGSNYKIAKFSGYSTASYWYSLMFNCSRAMIDRVIAEYGKPSTGARCDITLRFDRGQTIAPNSGSTITLARKGETGSITATNDGSTIRKEFTVGRVCDNFRVELDWANGSATNPLKIRKLRILGHFIERN